MEPSLRSSRPPAIGCVLPRTDKSLHESAQRIVESLSDDLRISQYADLAFAMKKMEGRAWYWLKSLPGAKMGFLVCQPKSPVVWIDEQFKVSYKLPMRFAASVLEKGCVFLASLNRTMGVVQLEDCWMYKNSIVRGKKFSDRWAIVSKVLTLEYREDPMLQRGFSVQAASFLPLTDLRKIDPLPPFLLAQGEDYSRRLRVQLGDREGGGGARAEGGGRSTQSARPLFVDDEVPAAPAPAPSAVEGPVEETPPGTAYAVPHDEYPDTYNLFVNGQKKGYAAVQDLALSRKLKAACAGKTNLLVKIDWNEEFKMYEILSLV